MRRLMGRAARRHGTRLMAAPHLPRRRLCEVPVADAADVLEVTLGTTLGSPLSAILTGGDVDADWMRAWDSGDEAVGGSVATPDQDIVDEIGRALGVEQESDAEVWTSQEILRERDRHRWQQEE